METNENKYKTYQELVKKETGLTHKMVQTLFKLKASASNKDIFIL